MELELQEQASGTWGPGTQTPSQSKEASTLASWSADGVICVRDTYICSTCDCYLKYLQLFLCPPLYSPSNIICVQSYAFDCVYSKGCV